MRLNEPPCWEQVTLTWLPTFAFPPYSADSLWWWSPRCHCYYTDPAGDRCFSDVPLDPAALLNKLWVKPSSVWNHWAPSWPAFRPARCGKAELEATGSWPRYQVSKKCKCSFFFLSHIPLKCFHLLELLWFSDHHPPPTSSATVTFPVNETDEQHRLSQPLKVLSAFIARFPFPSLRCYE